MATKILIFGSGAIGTIYVYLLLKAGCDVTAVCRSNYEAAEMNGFLIDSAVYGNGIHIAPKVVRTTAETMEDCSYDYVLVCSKAFPGIKPSTPEIIQPAVTPGKTCIVLLQNGVGIEEEYAETFPKNPLLSCVVYLPATQTSPGHISMGDFESLEIGTYPASAYHQAGPKAAAEIFAETLRVAGGNAKIFEDIQPQRWAKLLLNASWNPITALTLSRDVAFMASSDVAVQYVRDVMAEVVTIAEALGYKEINGQLLDVQMKRAVDRIGSKGLEPSMLVDALSGRRMEVEVILGNPTRIAKKKGVSVPRLEGLYALTKALDESIALRKPGQSLGGDELPTT